MRIVDIAEHPTSIDRVHESCFRSWFILDYAVELLEAGTPGPVVARIIRELRELPHVDKARDDR